MSQKNGFNSTGVELVWLENKAMCFIYIHQHPNPKYNYEK